VSALIVSAIITGSLYTVTALGLVAVYKTTRVFNFAHGMTSAFCAYCAYQVTVQWEQPFAVGLVGGVVAGAAVGFLIERLLLSRLYQRSPLELVIATFGVSMILQYLIIRWWGHDERTIPVPFGGDTFEVFDVVIPYYGLTVVIFAAAVVVGLTVFLRATRIGLALRMVFDDPVAARLMGVRVAAVRSLSWTLGGALAGAAGVLLTPILFLNPATMTTILITAFAAAVVGGFNSFFGALAGGMAVALTLNLGAYYVSLRFRNLILYSLIVVFLWFRPYGLFGHPEEEAAEQEGERPGRVLQQWQRFLLWLAGLGTAARRNVLGGFAPQWFLHLLVIASFFLLQPLLGDDWTLNLSLWLVHFVAVAGLALLLFYGGQFSLAQNTFMCIGAYSVALFLGRYPDQWIVSILVAIGVCLALSLLMALPSARLHGAYFAAMTLAIGLAGPELANKWSAVTGGANGKGLPTPTIGGEPIADRTMYFIFAGIATLVFVGLIAFRNSPPGRSMVAARDAPNGARALAISPYKVQVLTIAVGSTLGGLAGAMHALHSRFVAPTSFLLELALMLFVATVVGGSITGAAWGAAVITLAPVTFKSLNEASTALFGVVLIAVLFLFPRDMSLADVLRRQRSARAPAAVSDADNREPARLVSSAPFT
jgi:branched-chain amino acid transport system permease protein